MSYSLENGIDFDIVCSSCGDSLNADIKRGRYNDYEIKVDICERCLSKKDDEICGLNDRIKELEDELENENNILKDKLAALETELIFNKIINKKP